MANFIITQSCALKEVESFRDDRLTSLDQAMYRSRKLVQFALRKKTCYPFPIDFIAVHDETSPATDCYDLRDSV